MSTTPDELWNAGTAEWPCPPSSSTLGVVRMLDLLVLGDLLLDLSDARHSVDQPALTQA